RGLIHLSEYQSGLFQNSGFFHLCPQVITLTGTFSNTGKDRISAVFCGNIADQLLDQYGLTNTSAAEETNLTAFCIRSQQVDNLNSCFQDFYYRALILKRRRVSVDNPMFAVV